MNRLSKVIVISLAVAGLAGGASVYAKGGHGMGERMVGHLSDRLDLTEQQAESLSILQTELRETRELMRATGDRQTLIELIGADTFDQGAALEMITERTTAMQTQAPELVAAAATFLDGLSAEQKTELSEMMERFSEKRGRHGRDRGE